MEYRNRILIVDDDDFLRESLIDDLCDDYEVYATSSGEEALKLLSDLQRLDLILLDVKMPGMSGYELHERIKDIPVCHEVPVIYLTGLTHPDEEIKGMESGAADFITKPCDPNVLLVRVKSRMKAAKRLDMKKIEALADVEAFTDTELCILQGVALSMSNEEIADRMGYSLGYVKNMLTTLFRRLDIDTRSAVKEYLL
ncbi:MAG: response regulator transcription factor [Lachnospiraceae bacterium]|nr:response regulator transcription factor [Lachnospiraceae bacterium]